MPRMITILREEDEYIIQLNGALTIIHAAELKDPLIEAVEKGEPEVILDLTGVEEMDSAGFQLLVMMQRVAKLSSRSLSVRSWSPAAHAVVELYDMFEYFEA